MTDHHTLEGTLDHLLVFWLGLGQDATEFTSLKRAALAQSGRLHVILVRLSLDFMLTPLSHSTGQ